MYLRKYFLSSDIALTHQYGNQPGPGTGSAFGNSQGVLITITIVILILLFHCNRNWWPW